jgi:ABC-type polysaccharide/polyol phosphate export permease
MAVIIEGYRLVLVHGQPPDSGSLAIVAAGALTLLWLGYWAFKRLERQFVDIV